MGKHFSLTLQLPRYQSARQAQSKRTASSEWSLTSGHYGAVLLVALLVCSISYLFLVNSFSAAGYQINKLQNQVSGLQNQYKQLQLQAAQLQSMSAIQVDPAVTSMVPVTNIGYISATTLTER